MSKLVCLSLSKNNGDARVPLIGPILFTKYPDGYEINPFP
jgi:hypothetical protein